MMYVRLRPSALFGLLAAAALTGSTRGQQATSESSQGAYVGRRGRDMIISSSDGGAVLLDDVNVAESLSSVVAAIADQESAMSDADANITALQVKSNEQDVAISALQSRQGIAAAVLSAVTESRADAIDRSSSTDARLDTIEARIDLILQASNLSMQWDPAPLPLHWVQRGRHIFGGDHLYFGSSLSASADGSTVAVGARHNCRQSANDTAWHGGCAASVLVLRWNGAEWAPKGPGIHLPGYAYSQENQDQIQEVRLSADGNALAVGSHLASGAGLVFDVDYDQPDNISPPGGRVRVYRWNGTGWPQQGGDIHGDAPGDYAGHMGCLAMSADGNVVAMGAPGHDGDNGTDVNAGNVRVQQWDGHDWVQLGGSIDGEAGDQSGVLSLSGDGRILAVGAHHSDDRRGRVRIHQWNGAAWAQLGSDLAGQAPREFLGRSVSVSADGKVIAVGASGRQTSRGPGTGQVQVFQWAGADWSQIGGSIDGSASYDQFGSCTVLSGDGKTVAVAAPYHDGFGTNAGHVRVHRWTGTDWRQVGADISHQSSAGGGGMRLSISSDGSVIGVGVPSYDTDAQFNTGVALVFAV